MQTPLQLDIWLQSYEGFVNAKNNIKQRNLNTVFDNISKTTSPTSDSFLLIMSHMFFQCNCDPMINTYSIASGHVTAYTQLTSFNFLTILHLELHNFGSYYLAIQYCCISIGSFCNNCTLDFHVKCIDDIAEFHKSNNCCKYCIFQICHDELPFNDCKPLYKLEM